MTVISRNVFSSNVIKLAYDDERLQLLVYWTKTKPGKEVSVYEGVTEDVFEKVVKSVSIGNAIQTEIKPNYKHHYLGPDE